MNARRIGVAAATVLVAIAATGAAASSGHGKRTPKLPRCGAPTDLTRKACAHTVSWRLSKKISAAGHVTKSTALAEFAAEIAPLPGVPRASGPLGFVPDGTGALSDVLRFLPQLSRAQRTTALAVLRALAGPAAKPSRHASTRAFAAGGNALDAFLRALTSSPVSPEGERLARTYTAYFARELGVPLGQRIVVRQAGPLTGLGLTGLLGVMGAAIELDAEGNPDGVGPPATCSIILTPLALAAKALSSADFDSVVAHEVFHCFQATMAGDMVTARTLESQVKWLQEGSADWASCQAVPSTHLVVEDDLAFVLTAGQSLLKRQSDIGAYSAAVFFGQLQDSGIQVFHRLRATYDAGPTSDLNPTYYKRLVGGAGGAQEADVLQTWASGLYQDASRTGPWNLAMPCNQFNLVRAHVRDESVAANATKTITVAPVANVTDALHSSADVVTVTVVKGFARVSGFGKSDGHPPVDDALSLRGGSARTTVTYCTKKGGCVCPAGETPAAGVPTPTTQLDPDPRPYLALTGDLNGGEVTLKGYSLGCHGAAINLKVSGAANFTYQGGPSVLSQTSCTGPGSGLTFTVKDSAPGVGPFTFTIEGTSTQPGTTYTWPAPPGGPSGTAIMEVGGAIYYSDWSVTGVASHSGPGTATIQTASTPGSVNLTMGQPGSSGATIVVTGDWHC